MIKLIAKYILTLLLLLSFGVIAEYTYNKPNITLLDKDKQPVTGASGSTDYARCLQKANNLGDGIYHCRQPDIKVTVSNKQQHPEMTTVSWKAPAENTDNTPLTDLVGFKVYYGLSPGDLSNVIDVDNPLAKELIIKELAPNTYYFAVSAVNFLGVESDLSNISSKLITY